MQRYIILSITILSFFILSGCVATQPKKVAPKKEDNSTKELKLDILNKEILSKMPIFKKIDDNTTLKIASAIIERDGKSRDGVEVNTDFIYKSFAIPEGIVGRVTLKGKIVHKQDEHRLYLSNLRADKFTFADTVLAKYITKKDKELITQIVSDELVAIPLYSVSSKVKRLDISRDKITLKYGN